MEKANAKRKLANHHKIQFRHYNLLNKRNFSVSNTQDNTNEQLEGSLQRILVKEYQNMCNKGIGDNKISRNSISGLTRIVRNRSYQTLNSKQLNIQLPPIKSTIKIPKSTGLLPLKRSHLLRYIRTISLNLLLGKNLKEASLYRKSIVKFLISRQQNDTKKSTSILKLCIH